MQNENYIVIQGWMVNELKLTGNELLVYAIIYGFSQDRNSCFQGTSGYLSKSLNISKQSVFNILKKLTENNFIIKLEKEINSVKLIDYKVNYEIIDNIGGSQKTLQGIKKIDGGSKNFLGGDSKETLSHNTNIDNNIDNNNIYTSKPKTACDSDISKKNKKPKELNALQEFSNEVIKNFEKLEEHQIPIWFKRNCRCLSDILKFCGGKKEDIPLALECISICCALMEKKGFMAGYEAVCRNLPYYYEEAKKKLRR